MQKNVEITKELRVYMIAINEKYNVIVLDNNGLNDKSCLFAHTYLRQKDYFGRKN